MKTQIKNIFNNVRISLRQIFRLENRYTAMQKLAYATGTSDHLEHNENQDYWDILLRKIKDRDVWVNKSALDFASGKGRNVQNLLALSDWLTVDGVDISEKNIEYCKSRFNQGRTRFYCSNGVDVSCLESNKYDFVMSTIALQHIPVYDIRRSIFKDLLRVMKPGGLLSFQMGFGKELCDDLGNLMGGYFDNCYDAKGTNSNHDVQITNPLDLVRDLQEIGLVDIEYTVRPSFSDAKHKEWIYVECYKP